MIAKNTLEIGRKSPERTFWLRYLAFMFLGNMIWEVVQLPLYTVWWTESTEEILFDVIHCGIGDVLIASVSLAFTILVFGRKKLPSEGRVGIAVAAIFFGIVYTLFSEWHNTVVLKSWSYSDLMPTVPFIGTGISPLAQWIVLPLLGFYWARSWKSS